VVIVQISESSINGTTAEAPAPKAIRFNPFTPAFRRDPYGAYRQLRQEAPVHKERTLWVLTRAADIKAVMSDLRFSSAAIRHSATQHAKGLEPEVLQGLVRLGEKSVVFTDKPEHTRLRRLVGEVINTKALEAKRPEVQARTERLLDELRGATRVEYISQVADVVPLHVVSDMMNLPLSMRPTIRDWTHEVRHLLEPAMMSPRAFRRIYGTLQQYMSLCQELIDERRRNPGDDLISGLLAARHREDRLSDEEISYTIIMTFVAGHETTLGLLGNGLLALLQHPEELALLRARPELLRNAIQEMLRYDCPLQMTQRLATADVEVAGHRIANGEQVLLILGAANRDPELCKDPEKFRVARDDVSHVAFGHGIHNCIGGALATMEAEVVTEAVLRRWSSIALRSEQPSWVSESFILRGLERLDLEVTWSA
jgi:cytochrome P450